MLENITVAAVNSWRAQQADALGDRPLHSSGILFDCIFYYTNYM